MDHSSVNQLWQWLGDASLTAAAAAAATAIAVAATGIAAVDGDGDYRPRLVCDGQARKGHYVR